MPNAPRRRGSAPKSDWSTSRTWTTNGRAPRWPKRSHACRWPPALGISPRAGALKRVRT